MVSRAGDTVRGGNGSGARNRGPALIETIRASPVTTEIALRLCDCGHAGCEGTAADFLVPLLVPPEEELVFHEWAARVISVVVAAQLGLTRLVLFGEVVICIECVIASRIEHAAVNLVRAGSRRKADDLARCLTILRAVGVPDHLEFGDGVDCGIDQDG